MLAIVLISSHIVECAETSETRAIVIERHGVAATSNFD
jgi:hypothetical protein